MTQPTPGPWIISSSTLVVTKEARVIAQCAPLGIRELHISLSEAIANARLIAQAPAMREALANLINVCEAMGQEVDTFFDDWLERITKARSILKGTE